MKIKKSHFKKMVEEELQKVMKEFISEKDESQDETGDQPEKSAKQTSKKPSTADAIKDNGDREKSDTSQKQPDNIMTKAGKGETPVQQDEVPLEDDPADDELAGKKEDESGISSKLAGKQVSSITMNKESKMMPGGIEIDLKFGKSDSPLKILIGKSGLIKFFYKGSLHNEL